MTSSPPESRRSSKSALGSEETASAAKKIAQNEISGIKNAGVLEKSSTTSRSSFKRAPDDVKDSVAAVTKPSGNIPIEPRLGLPLFMQGQALPPTALVWSFQQQQQQQRQQMVPPTPQLNQPASVNRAYWNAFSVIGSSRIEPFPERLHRLLREVEATGRTDVISWVHGGQGFEIHKSNEFFRDIVPHYFKQSKLSSFKRQLGLYGFQLFSPNHTKGGSGTMKGYYAHELFLRDMPDLCRKMRRNNQRGTTTFGKSTTTTSEL